MGEVEEDPTVAPTTGGWPPRGRGIGPGLQRDNGDADFGGYWVLHVIRGALPRPFRAGIQGWGWGVLVFTPRHPTLCGVSYYA
jgi:hypothetical protein